MPSRKPSRPTTVDGLVIESGKILLVKRKKPPYAGRWVLPGGYVDPGETVEKAVAREVWEETGLRTKIKNMVGVYSDPSRDPRGTIAVAFKLTKLGGKLRVKTDETKEVKWFSISKLPSLGFDHNKIVRDALKR